MAVNNLENAVDVWKTLSLAWSTHYMPYKMARTKQIFGYSYYIDDVAHDVEIARAISRK